MSLEETIAANTAAVLALTAALKADQVVINTTFIGGPKAGETSATPVLDIVVPKSAGGPTPAEQAELAALLVGVEADKVAVAAKATITDVLTAASILMANPAKGKAALKAALEKAGVTKIKAISEVPADKLDAALAAINAAIAA